MRQMGRKIVCGAVGLLFLSLMAGCATVNRKVTLLYQPVVHDGTGKGALYLAATPGTTGHADVQWVLGKVKNEDGELVGDIVSPIAPTDVALDALRQELGTAGYKVSTVGSLPQQAAKGIVVTGVDFHLAEAFSLVKSDDKCRVKISMELWKNGAKFRKLSYESSLSDFAVKDRDLLAQNILQKALQDTMQRAIPEIIAAFEH